MNKVIFFLGMFVFLLILCVKNTIFNDKQTDTITISDARTQESGTDPHPNLSHLENEKYATPDNPVISPSGKYKMVIELGYNEKVYYNRFIIYKTDGDTLLFSSPAQFRTRDRLLFVWDKQDNVWIYSGDLGIFCWEKEGDVWVNDNKKIEPEYYPGVFGE